MKLRLYHFLNQKYGMEAIQNKRLKISRLVELNDPFEMAGLNLRNRRDRLVWEKTKRDISDFHGIVCMSGNWKNPLLWSHYADRHKGICLGFDISEQNFRSVEYRKNRIELRELGIDSIDQITSDHMEKILHIKFEDWRYEDEYRAFTGIDEIDLETGHAFIPFSESLILKEVIAGIASSVTRNELQSLLEVYNYDSEIHCYKARLAFKSFGITMQKNKAIWS